MELKSKNVLLLLINLIIGILSAILLCLSLKHFMKVPNYSSEINFLFPKNIANFTPEPVEKTQYMMSLIIFPLIVFVLTLIQIKLKIPDRFIKNSNDKIIEILVMCIYAIAFLTLVILDFRNNKFFSEYYALKTNAISTIIFFFGFLIASFLYFKFAKNKILLISLSKYFLFFVAIIFSAYISIMNVYSIHYVTENGMFTSHLNAVYYSVVAVASGQYLLADISNQYGLYPHFLKPLYSLIDLNIYSFTWTMATFVFFTFVGILYFFKKTIKHPIITFFGFTSLLYFCYIRARLVFEDPYFQYFPIRTLFPVISLIIASYYFKKPTKTIYYLSFPILSLGVLWNLDTGLISFASWLAVLCFQAFSNREWENVAKYLMTAVISFVVVSGLFLCYIALGSGRTPDIFGMLKYIQYFYTYGISMEPMKLINPWNIVLLIYAISLTYTIVCMVKKNNNYRINLIFMLSILGLGLFSYYQGRSDDNVLPNVIYPAIIISTIFLDHLLQDWMSHKRNYFKLTIVISIVFIMFSATESIYNNFDKLKLIFNSRWENTIKRPVTPITTGVEFIKSHTKTGDRTLILSFQSGLYYSESKTMPAIGGTGSSEMFLKSDFYNLESIIKEKRFPFVYLDKNYLSMLYSANINIVQTLMDNYKLVDSSESGNIMRLSSTETKNNNNIKIDSDFIYDNNTVIDYKTYSDSFIYNVQNKKMIGFFGSWLSGLTLNENSFTIQMIVKPQRKQEPYAVIAGNHPGQLGHEGFVIMSENGIKDTYEFSYGDGKMFTEPFLFKLDAEKWNYLVVTLNGKKVSIYDNGTLVKEQDQKNKFVNSGLPFIIGDWIPANRPFKGSVLEFKVSNDILSKEEIVRTYNKINDNVLTK